MKIWKTLFIILGIIPWTFIVSLMKFYSKAGEILGYAPSYNKPDPGELDIYTVYSPYIEFTGSLWMCSFAVWVLLAISYIIARRNQFEWTPIVISGIGQMFAVLLFFLPVFEWYID